MFIKNGIVKITELLKEMGDNKQYGNIQIVIQRGLIVKVSNLIDYIPEDKKINIVNKRPY